MSTPILSTKLYIPPPRPDDLVPRPHQIKHLNDGLHRKLILVSAPAGFGKTTLVSEWLGQSNLPAAWLTLDKDDNDLARFLIYLIAALETAQAEIGDDIQMLLQSPQPPPLETTMTMLINRLATATFQFVVVLDDYHVIKQQSIHQALAFLVDHLPTQMHLVIASRADPPLPLSRWRGRDQLIELREADLRFSTAEAATFLNKIIGLNLSAGQVKALANRTEGWITGLHLAALSMHHHEDIAGFVNDFTGSHHYILDYLTDEILNRQPETVQRFLFQTSILDRLSGPLCNAVLGKDGEKNLTTAPPSPHSLKPRSSQQILEYLEASNLFTIPLDDERHWYRYHRLFADFLRSRLVLHMSDQVSELHHRASKWYEQQGLLTPAIAHAISSQDYERAVFLIEAATDLSLMRGEISTLQSWIELLPDDVVRTRPLLCVYHAITLIFGGNPVESASSRLQDAMNADSADPAFGGVVAFRAWVAAMRGETRQTIKLSQQALKLLPKNSSFLRSLVSASVGLTYIVNGDFEPAFKAFSDVADIGQKTDNVMLTVIALRRLAEIRLIQGRFSQAEAFYKQALAMALDRQGRPRPIAGLALIGLGWLQLERNNLDEATQHLTEGIALTTKWSNVASVQGYIGLANAKQAQRDIPGARQAIETAGQLALRSDVTQIDDILVGAAQARLWVAQSSEDPGCLEAALDWVENRGLALSEVVGADEKDEQADHPSLSFVRVLEYIPLARIFIAQSKFDKALAVLKPLLAVTENAGWVWLSLEIMTLQAIAYRRRGDAVQALAILERALVLAEPEGFVRVFIDHGPPIADLLRQAAAQGLALDYVGKLLAAFDTGKKKIAAPLSHSASTALIEPLSQREIEVLRLLAAGLSNKEVANTLIITVGTVKKHLKNVYGKLNVHSRTAAVARARDLDIL